MSSSSSSSSSPSFRSWAQSHALPADEYEALTGSVIPALLTSIARIGAALRSAHAIAPAAGETLNAFGDAQLNVDVEAEGILRDALARCPAVATASSEEDPVERRVAHDDDDDDDDEPQGTRRRYTVAFDPLDGSSIVGANWAVGTIAGVWLGDTALAQPPSRQVAAVLGVYGPRTTALVALRLPGRDALCIEVAPSEEEDDDGKSGSSHRVLARRVVFVEPTSPPPSTRYFAPANLRAAAEDPRYWALVEGYVRAGWTLRYSGGLVPDVVHALAKGHGVYLSPATPRSRAKLRRLYELLPVALVIESAGGAALDPADGKRVLDRAVHACDERGALVCGSALDVEHAVARLTSDLPGGCE